MCASSSASFNWQLVLPWIKWAHMKSSTNTALQLLIQNQEAKTKLGMPFNRCSEKLPRSLECVKLASKCSQWWLMNIKSVIYIVLVWYVISAGLQWGLQICWSLSHHLRTQRKIFHIIEVHRIKGIKLLIAVLTVDSNFTKFLIVLYPFVLYNCDT